MNFFSGFFRREDGQLIQNAPPSFFWDDLVLFSDVRIDNREELLDPLELKPSALAGDDELVLRAYRKWGESSPEKLLGDFAFAIWDKKRRAIFCARDHFGVRPFYYFKSEKFFVFASEIKTIVNFKEISRQLDETMIANFLLWDNEDQESTFYKGVKRLLPATSMTVDATRMTARRYWSLDPNREIKLSSNEEYAERFRDLFTEAVRCRLRSASPVGCLLSGGLDSSAVTSMARVLLSKEGKRIDAFSSVYEKVPSSDEREFIQPIVSMEGVRAHFIQADRIAPFFKIKDLFRSLDEPNTYELSMFWGGIYPEAQRLGIKVLLDGDGGDEAVCHGYTRLAELLSQFRWVEYGRTLHALSKNIKRSMPDLFLNKSLRPLIPSQLLRYWRVMRWGHRSLWFDRGLYNKAFLKRIGIENKESARIQYETSPDRTVKEEHYHGLVSGAVPYAFQIMSQSASAFGIEHRYPFHDRRLVEYCLSLPSDQKLYRGWTRVVMRRALEGILPDKVRWRGGKTYLADEFVYRLNAFEKEILDRVIMKDPSRIEGYYDVDELRKRVHLFLAKPDYEKGIMLWQAVMFSLWLENVN